MTTTLPRFDYQHPAPTGAHRSFFEHRGSKGYYSQNVCSADADTEIPYSDRVGRISRDKGILIPWMPVAWNPKIPLQYWMPSSEPLGQFLVSNVETESAIEKCIADSRRILDLKDDWDGEGALGYSKEVWEKSCNFVRLIASQALVHFSVCIEPPSILPGPCGSIDVHWKNPSRELLVNIPPASGFASFYGDDYGSLQIKGTLDPLNPPIPLLLLLPTSKR